VCANTCRHPANDQKSARPASQVDSSSNHMTLYCKAARLTGRASDPEKIPDEIAICSPMRHACTFLGVSSNSEFPEQSSDSSAVSHKVKFRLSTGGPMSCCPSTLLYNTEGNPQHVRIPCAPSSHCPPHSCTFLLSSIRIRSVASSFAPSGPSLYSCGRYARYAGWNLEQKSWIWGDEKATNKKRASITQGLDICGLLVAETRHRRSFL
jgi:hypothetical protein